MCVQLTVDRSYLRRLQRPLLNDLRLRPAVLSPYLPIMDRYAGNFVYKHARIAVIKLDKVSADIKDNAEGACARAKYI